MADGAGYRCSDAGDGSAVTGCGSNEWADEDVVTVPLTFYLIVKQEKLAWGIVVFSNCVIETWIIESNGFHTRLPSIRQSFLFIAYNISSCKIPRMKLNDQTSIQNVVSYKRYCILGYNKISLYCKNKLEKAATYLCQR